MKATFDNLDDYLEELRTCAATREPDMRPAMVRGTIQETVVNGAQSEFKVVSGFIAHHCFHEMTLACGKDSRSGRRMESSSKDTAQHALQAIKQACDDLKIEFRGGTWVLT